MTLFVSLRGTNLLRTWTILQGQEKELNKEDGEEGEGEVMGGEGGRVMEAERRMIGGSEGTTRRCQRWEQSDCPFWRDCILIPTIFVIAVELISAQVMKS